MSNPINVAICVNGEVLLTYSTQTPPRVGEYITVYEPQTYDEDRSPVMGARRMRVCVTAIEHSVQVVKYAGMEHGEHVCLLGYDLVAHAGVAHTVLFTDIDVAKRVRRGTEDE